MNTTHEINIDEVKSRVDLLQVVERELGQGKRSGAWVMFFCPFHENSRSEALAVNVKTQTWKCFGCDKGGDVLTWTMLRDGVEFREALGKLAGGVDWNAPVSMRSTTQPVRLDGPPASVWQARGREFLRWVQGVLFEDAGACGLAELGRRGITPETAAAWGVGFCPKRLRDAGPRWGLEDVDGGGAGLRPARTASIANLFRGLVFPSVAGGELWRIKFRLFEGDVPKREKPKYLNAPGSGKALFGADHLMGRETLLLCEGEPDALLAWQEVRYFADVMTLGGAGMRLEGRWLPFLLPYRRVVVVYDPDAAGAKGAEQLQALGARVEVHRPPGGDLCEMKARGEDVLGWLAEILL